MKTPRAAMGLLAVAVLSVGAALPVVAQNAPVSDSEHEIQTIYLKHYRAFEQLSRQHVPGMAVDQAPLPKQKNIKVHGGGPVGGHEAAKPVSFDRPAPTEYTFKSDNVWAKITIHLTDNHGNFRIVGECDASVSGWVLKGNNKQEVAKGRCNDSQSFAFNINEAYSPDMVLTVYVTKDAFTNPAYIPLKN